MRKTGDVDFDAVADELYALAPTEFIAARTSHAKQARSEGDRLLAQQIQVLRKPTTAAWIVNQLVRERPDEIQPLLDLGLGLRDVMADLGADELREMTRQRYRLVSSLVQQARALGHAQGQRITEEAALAVRATLEATLSDPSSAELVAAARLSETLQVSGFGVADGAGADAGAGSLRLAESPAPSESATITDLDVERQRRRDRQQAERKVDAAVNAVRRASDALSAAQVDLRSVEEQRQEAAATAVRLRRELDQATASCEQLQKKETSARKEIDAAKRDLEAAEASLATARSRRGELS